MKQFRDLCSFFCSSRRRHTRSYGDWSSDVCSSDLKSAPKTKVILLTQHSEDQYVTESLRAGVRGYVLKSQAGADLVHAIRSEERRVGNEGGCWWGRGSAEGCSDSRRERVRPHRCAA